MIRAWSWAASALALTLTACATPPPEDGSTRPTRQCFWANNARSFNAIDNRTVLVTVGVRDVYKFELFSSCPDINWNHRIALQSRGGSSICSGLDATIITRGPTGPQRCQVRTVTRLTPEEAQALRAGARR